jgi:hypothetical protein
VTNINESGMIVVILRDNHNLIEEVFDVRYTQLLNNMMLSVYDKRNALELLLDDFFAGVQQMSL